MRTVAEIIEELADKYHVATHEDILRQWGEEIAWEVHTAIEQAEWPYPIHKQVVKDIIAEL